MRARYGVSVVNTNSYSCSASVTGELYAISCCIRPCYNDTQLYYWFLCTIITQQYNIYFALLFVITSSLFIILKYTKYRSTVRSWKKLDVNAYKYIMYFTKFISIFYKNGRSFQCAIAVFIKQFVPYILYSQHIYSLIVSFFYYTIWSVTKISIYFAT